MPSRADLGQIEVGIFLGTLILMVFEGFRSKSVQKFTFENSIYKNPSVESLYRATKMSGTYFLCFLYIYY
jgi:hypothetical protein